MKIDRVYHWSPTTRREGILKEGLRVYSESVTHSGFERFPYLCFGSTASKAWSLSGDMESTSGVEEWDLWQVNLIDGDEVRFRSEFSPEIYEIRVHNSIPADRIWYVATRSGLLAI